MKVLGFTIGRTEAKEQPKNKPAKKQRMSDNVNKPQPDRVTMEMDALKSAIEEARDTQNPSWVDLIEIYRNSRTDPKVKSEETIAINKLYASPFVVRKDDNDDEELTKLFKRPWFPMFLAACFDKDMEGYTLVEFGQQDENGEFIDCQVFPVPMYTHLGVASF